MAPSSFELIPEAPFDAQGLEALRQRLASYPSYHDPVDDLYVIFGSPEERRETVALYSRATTPTFDVESFVQIRSARLFVHIGEEPEGRVHLRDFLDWLEERQPLKLVHGGEEHSLNEVLPPTDDVGLA